VKNGIHKLIHFYQAFLKKSFYIKKSILKVPETGCVSFIFAGFSGFNVVMISQLFTCLMVI